MNRFKGFFFGMLASASFGLIPLFTLPMMQEGLQADSILTYRMLLASALVAVLMLLRGVSFATCWRELPWFAFLGFFYYGSATLLFQGYHSMSSGMATTLHFLYPIGVTLIMPSLRPAHLAVHDPGDRAGPLGGSAAEPQGGCRYGELAAVLRPGAALGFLLRDLSRGDQ